MGSGMLACLEGDSKRARRLLSQVPGWFEGWEACLSRFRPESELNLLNQQAGQWVKVSPVLWDVLEAARKAEWLSDGLVTPALQGALEAQGYDRDFALVATMNAEMQLSALQVETGLPGRLEMEADPETFHVRLPFGTRLDLGGIAKGWAADRAQERLAEFGPALVDAGGDIAASPLSEPESRWPIGVTDPYNPEDTIALLALAGGGAATSGRDFRRWWHDGRWRHHIIDARTGEPAASDVLTATVVAPTAVEAETAAKCALIRGGEEGLAWLNARPEYAGLLVLEDADQVFSQGMESYLWSE